MNEFTEILKQDWAEMMYREIVRKSPFDKFFKTFDKYAPIRGKFR